MLNLLKMISDTPDTPATNQIILCFSLVFRTRRRSGSSIVVLGGDDTLKPSLPIDDYQEEVELYNMISANQDNGKFRQMMFMHIFFLPNAILMMISFAF